MIPRRNAKPKLEDTIIRIQTGDTRSLDHLLKDYQPFIAKCVSEVCKRYINPKCDDEFSIGLAAFHEAVLTYSSERGSSFLSFAKLVVKRKVIDYIRYMQKFPNATSLDETGEEEQMENPSEILAANDLYQHEQEVMKRREEILEFKEKLTTYKLSFAELTAISPKHRDARESAILAARTLYEDVQLRTYVEEKRKLPIKALEKKVTVSKKTLERNRKYILAMFIVLSNDFLYLNDYLKEVKR